MCVCGRVEKINGRKIYTLVWMKAFEFTLPTRVSTKTLPTSKVFYLKLF